MDSSPPGSPLPRDLMSHSPAPAAASPVLVLEDNGDDETDDSPEIPLTMSASVVLADLPRDATAALESVGDFKKDKVVVKFKAVGSAPALSQDLCKINAVSKFEQVVRYLRRKLRCKDTDSVFLYVNSAFAPSLDEVVGNLHQVCEALAMELSLTKAMDCMDVGRANGYWTKCFKNANDQLVVAYSITPAFG